MKLYTKTGDDGSTGLHGGLRLSKSHPRVEAYGQTDELNAAIGLARTTADPKLNELINRTLLELQSLLFDVGAELSTPSDTASETAKKRIRTITDTDIIQLESAIDEVESLTPPQKSFILPGGSELAARLHLARTICRRAERAVIQLVEHDQNTNGPGVSDRLIIMLNRTGDLLFILARLANTQSGIEDIPWPTKQG